MFVAELKLKSPRMGQTSILGVFPITVSGEQWALEEKVKKPTKPTIFYGFTGKQANTRIHHYGI